MMLLKTAWRNIGRNKRRSVLTALAVAFAVAVLMFSMALQRGSYTDMIRNTVHAHTGNLQVQRAGYWPDRELAKGLGSPDEVIKAVEDLPHVTGVAPRVNGTALISAGNRTFGAAIFGIDPVREPSVSVLGDVVSKGEFLKEDDLTGALVGEKLARNLGVTVGDEIIFIGQGADGSLAAGRLEVRGLFKTGVGDMDRTTIAAHVATVQDAFSMHGSVSEVAVLLDHDKFRPAVKASVEERLRNIGMDQAVVLDWPTLLPGVEQGIKMDWTSGLVIYGVLVLVVGFGIANTFLMAFLERIREFGMLMALGMQPIRVSIMVYLESIILVLLGVAGGFAAGVPLVLYYQFRGISFSSNSDLMAQYGLSPVVHLELSGLVVGWTLGLVLSISLLVAIAPALRASRLRIVEALHHT